MFVLAPIKDGSVVFQLSYSTYTCNNAKTHAVDIISISIKWCLDQIPLGRQRLAALHAYKSVWRIKNPVQMKANPRQIRLE